MAELKDGLVKSCVGLGGLSFILILVTTCLPYWRVSDPIASDPFMSQVKSVEGLWIRCTATVKEYYTCDWYDSAMIGLPAYITGFRALMIVAMMVSFGGVVMSVLGLACLNALPDERRKRHVVIGAGALHFVAGGVTCLCVSWYASEVVREFNDPLYEQTRQIQFTFGSSLYLGWISSLISVATASLLTLCHVTCSGDDVSSRRGKYAPPPTVAMATTTNRGTAAYQTTRSPIYTKAPRDADPRDQRGRHHHHYHGRGRVDGRYDNRRSSGYPAANDEGYV